MSQEYLNRLLSTPENRVQEECVICREPYGTLNTETGIIEAEIRLSCGHTVGSACIVTWLRDNNTCPHCRKEFFPRQPRPYLEHDIMDIGSQSTGRINATPSLTREPNVTRSRIAPAFAVPEPPAESRTSIFNAGGQGRDRLPTGPEVPSSPLFGSPPFRFSGLGESSISRGTIESQVPTSSDAGNSNANRSIPVRLPTGPEVGRSSLFSLSGFGGSSISGGTTGSEMRTSSNTGNSNARRSNLFRVPTGPEVPRSPFFTSPPFRYSGLGESSTVRVPTGSEASTDSFIRGSRDSDPRNLSSESEAFEDLCARLLQDLNRASQGFDRLSVSSRSETSTN